MRLQWSRSRVTEYPRLRCTSTCRLHRHPRRRPPLRRADAAETRPHPRPRRPRANGCGGRRGAAADAAVKPRAAAGRPRGRRGGRASLALPGTDASLDSARAVADADEVHLEIEIIVQLLMGAPAPRLEAALRVTPAPGGYLRTCSRRASCPRRRQRGGADRAAPHHRHPRGGELWRQLAAASTTRTRARGLELRLGLSRDAAPSELDTASSPARAPTPPSRLPLAPARAGSASPPSRSTPSCYAVATPCASPGVTARAARPSPRGRASLHAFLSATVAPPAPPEGEPRRPRLA